MSRARCKRHPTKARWATKPEAEEALALVQARAVEVGDDRMPRSVYFCRCKGFHLSAMTPEEYRADRERRRVLASSNRVLLSRSERAERARELIAA